MAGEDEAGRTPPTAEQAPQAQTQAHTTVTQAPAGEQSAAEAQGTPAQPAGNAAAQASDKPTEPPTNESPEATVEQSEKSAPGFGERGRMRRRSRFLRKARELAYRDLGGLVYDLHRFGQRNDQVVLAKLATLGHIDAELRALEDALHQINPVTVLREVGIAACPRCAAIHGNEDRFCPGCGLCFDAGADRPLSTAPVTVTPQGEASAPSTEPSPPAGTLAPISPPANQPALTSPPASTSPPAPRPAAKPLTTIERPSVPAPLSKPTAPPVAAKPQTVEESNGAPEPQDEPTQILRPPTGSA